LDKHGTVDQNALDAHREIKVLHKDNFDRVPGIRLDCHDGGPIVGIIGRGENHKVLVARKRFAIGSSGVRGKQSKEIERIGPEQQL
jgi:hypothetical protein